MNEYWEFLEKMKSKIGSFLMDCEAGGHNKSAALRARKLSMELRRDLQDFRKISVANDRASVKSRTNEAPQPEEQSETASTTTEAAV